VIKEVAKDVGKDLEKDAGKAAVGLLNNFLSGKKKKPEDQK
jgi:hypothetical protein